MSTEITRPLSAVLFGKTRRKVLALFFSDPDRRYHLREVARRVPVGLGAVQRELRALAEVGILLSEKRGNQLVFGANRECPVFPDLRGLVVKTEGLADVIRASLLPLAGEIRFAFIFGSQASGESGPKSDVDLFVVGSIHEMSLHRAVTEAEKTLDRPINYHLLTATEFRERRMEHEGFVHRVLVGPRIMILGNLADV